MMKYVCSEKLDYGERWGVVVRTPTKRMAFRGATPAEAYNKARDWIGDDAELMALLEESEARTRCICERLGA